MGRGRHARRATIGWLIAAAAATALLAFWAKLAWVASWAIGVNAVTLIAFALDKFAATQGMWRIPELALHTLALVGGSPAALIAQQLLRHKTAKRSFQLVFYAILILQVALLVWHFSQPR